MTTTASQRSETRTINLCPIRTPANPRHARKTIHEDRTELCSGLLMMETEEGQYEPIADVEALTVEQLMAEEPRTRLHKITQ